jgi:hypothetical protein
LVAQAARYENLLTTGVLQDTDEDEEYPCAYYSRVDEIPALLTASGFTVSRVLATEGIVAGIDHRLNALHGPTWDAWADLNYDLADDRGLLASSKHLITVAHRQKREPG